MRCRCAIYARAKLTAFRQIKIRSENIAPPFKTDLIRSANGNLNRSVSGSQKTVGL
jgi:hypothetical protein